MKQVKDGIIPIFAGKVGKEEANAVDARELYLYLGSKRQFGNWINERIETCRFKPGVDFLTFKKKLKRKPGVRGAATSTESGLPSTQLNTLP